MPHYINAIVDKSVLQSLSAREAKWLFHHFRVNIPPVLFAEVLGDLEKAKGLATGSAEGDVRMLASKITSHSVFLNEDHHNLVAGELVGYHIEMDGRPILGNAKVAQLPDGSLGSYVDQTPFQRVMDRWRSGDFDGMEREFAKVWRSDRSSIDLESLIRGTKQIWAGRETSLETVIEHAHAILFGPGRDYSHLDTLMQLADAEPSHRAKALRRWNQAGRPPPAVFLPYTAYVARLETIFILGLHAAIITTRSTNRIDIDYFKYLPFTQIFASGDRLHETLFSTFARRNQDFISGSSLKIALREMADYYDGLPEDERRLGL